MLRPRHDRAASLWTKCNCAFYCHFMGSMREYDRGDRPGPAGAAIPPSRSCQVLALTPRGRRSAHRVNTGTIPSKTLREAVLHHRHEPMRAVRRLPREADRITGRPCWRGTQHVIGAKSTSATSRCNAPIYRACRLVYRPAHHPRGGPGPQGKDQRHRHHHRHYPGRHG